MRIHALVALACLAVVGCLPGPVRGTYYSKTGRVYPAITPRAVIVDDSEKQAVIAAGGVVIGTIDAQANHVSGSDEDVAVWAAASAARAGGTHVAVLERGTMSSTSTYPATSTRSCTRTDDGKTCETQSTPESTSTVSWPYAKFEVLRVPAERWGQLPDAIRPGIASPVKP